MAARVEVYEGRGGRFFTRKVSANGRVTETGAGGKNRGWATRRGARRQAAIDFPGLEVVSV